MPLAQGMSTGHLPPGTQVRDTNNRGHGPRGHWPSALWAHRMGRAGQEQKQGTRWQLSEGGDTELGVLGSRTVSRLGSRERKQPPVRALSLLVMEEPWVEAKAPQGDPPPVAAKGQSAQSPGPLPSPGSNGHGLPNPCPSFLGAASPQSASLRKHSTALSVGEAPRQALISFWPVCSQPPSQRVALGPALGSVPLGA